MESVPSPLGSCCSRDLRVDLRLLELRGEFYFMQPGNGTDGILIYSFLWRQVYKRNSAYLSSLSPPQRARIQEPGFYPHVLVSHASVPSVGIWTTGFSNLELRPATSLRFSGICQAKLLWAHLVGSGHRGQLLWGLMNRMVSVLLTSTCLLLNGTNLPPFLWFQSSLGVGLRLSFLPAGFLGSCLVLHSRNVVGMFFFHPHELCLRWPRSFLVNFCLSLHRIFVRYVKRAVGCRDGHNSC